MGDCRPASQCFRRSRKDPANLELLASPLHTFERPRLLPTVAPDETFAGVTYHLDGELVPALTVELSASQSIYFEHHILLWKHPPVDIGCGR